MALARVKVWNAGDLLKAADLNGEFNNILNNPISLVSPTTGVITFSTAQTFPVPQLISTKTDAGAAVSLTTAGLHTEGTLVIPGTAPLQFNSSVQLQLGLGVIPLKTTSGNWVQRAVTVAITISATSTTGSGALVANQTNYVYAFDSAGVTGLEFRTTAGMPHSPSTENGTEVATTDATRTLVGMVRTNASTQFSNNSSQRFVASWYSRQLQEAAGALLTGPYTFNNVAYAETSSGARAEFVTWGDALPCRMGGGDASNATINALVGMAIGLDGATVVSRGAFLQQAAVAGIRGLISAVGSFTSSQATEGFHFVTPLSRVNTSTGTINTGSDPETTTVFATLRM